MSMPKAARIDDPISHSFALAGLVTGLVAGAALGAFVVFTGGAGALAIAAAACTWGSTAAGIGQLVGGAIRHTSGHIVTGARTVKIGKKFAARAVVDKVDCHPGKVIAEGSRTVFVENFPAARVDDKTQCDGKIEDGWPNVEIGKEAATYVNIESEVPLWLEIGVVVLGLLPGLVRGAFSLMRMAAGRGLIKCPGGSSRVATWFRETLGHPVDVATGDVVDLATDFSLPGAIPIIWERNYCSAIATEESSLGFGGWTHSFDQWIVGDGDLWSYRAGDGRDIYFAKVGPGESTFHRRDRLTLQAEADGVFAVREAGARLTKRFAPIEPGGRAYLRRIEDDFGNVIDLYYDDSRLSRIVDTAGRTIHVHSNTSGHVSRVEVWAHDELHQWIDYLYHPDGELATATNALGHADHFAYDAQHRMTKTTLKNGVSFYYAYDDELNRCIRTWGDGGLHKVEFLYDLGQGKTEVRGTEEPRVYFWDDSGMVVRQETLDGQCLRVVEVDPDGHIVAEGAIEAELTRYEHDERGNRIKHTDPAGNSTSWDYDGDQPSRRVGADGLITSYRHDARGALREVAYPSGLRALLDYDLHGRLVSVREGDRVVSSFEYDAEHNVVREVDTRGAATDYTYDALGRPIERVDALGRATQIEYDRLGQVVAMATPDGSVTRSEREPLGNISRLIDALGQVTELEYAGTGTLTRLVQPDGAEWRMEYDRDERLTEIHNPSDERYAFSYDVAGRVVSEQTFDGRVLRYRYTEAGHLASVEYPDDSSRLFRHDPLGNVLSDRSFQSGITFERDKLGRLTKAVLTESSGKVITELLRDEFGRVVQEKQNGKAIGYAYDAYGRRIERVLPDGSTTRYGYDPGGELAYVEHDGRRFEMARDELGREVSRRATAGGVEIRSAYDEMDRLVERHVAGGAAQAALTRRTWKYDALGRVKEISDGRWGTTVYQYDRIGQLIEAKRGAYHEVFQYDVTGSLRNILGDLTSAGHARAWDTQPGNLLAQTDKARYEYDACGRRTRKVALVDNEAERAGEATVYVWDDRDRLREVRKPGGERVLFTYDAFGRRVRKEVLPGEGQAARRTVEFFWDGDELAADIDSTRGRRVFVHEPGTFVPMLQAEQGEVFAVVNDHLGMPKELVDEDGRLAWSAAHSAWGRVVEASRDGARVESPFRLLGQYADEETGLCYTRFRYFDAETGRWCSPDPLGFDGGFNLFAFDGNPTTDVDPLGLACYAAQRVSGGLKIGRQISVKQAVQRLRRGLDVFSDTMKEARSIAKKALRGKPMSHGSHGQAGYYPHFHPNQHVNSSHSFYP